MDDKEQMGKAKPRPGVPTPGFTPEVPRQQPSPPLEPPPPLNDRTP